MSPLVPVTQAANLPGSRLQRITQNLIERALPPIAVFDPSGQVIFANRAFHDLPLASAGDMASEIAEALQEANLAGGHIRRSRVVDRGGGSIRHYAVDIFALGDGSDATAGAGAVFNDITGQVLALHQANEQRRRFDDIVRALTDWVWETDENGNLTYVSDHRVNLRFGGAEGVLGRPFFVFDPKIAVSGHQELLAAFERRTPFRSQLVELDDGLRLVHRISGTPVFSEERGRFLGFRGIAQDVTSEMAAERRAVASRQALESVIQELRQRNRDLAEALTRAEEAIRVKEVFMANVSHELRTPLNAILGYAEVISDRIMGDDLDRYSSYASLIRNAGTHLLGLVNSLLDSVLIDQERMPIGLEPCSLQDIVDRSAGLVAAQAAGKGQTIWITMPPTAIPVLVDRDRTVQIITNLLANAVKFSPEGGQIEVTAALREEHACVCVSDSGPGVPEALRDTVFDRFVTSSTAYTADAGGLGLGLAIARQLARTMGGDVRLEPSEMGGACFSATFPLADTDQPQSDEPA